ncbi:MAG: DUF3300 domain-containing protein [Candidatus Acidiferrales bacterium]
MERCNSLVRQFIVVILAVCINVTLAAGATGSAGAAGFSQAGNSSATSPEQLDKLLAPVALYPDALLMQVLAASVNSQEVLDGGNWLLQNKSLEGDQLDSAAKTAGFGPAMIALFHFPQVVDMMCSELDWTKQLGEAFTADQSAVLDSVQRLRLQAKQAGTLQTNPQQTVVTQQASGQQIIVIQPTNPQIIYVPQYNPVQVYVAPPPSQPYTGVLIAFGVGMAVGAMFSSNNYYYYPRWGYGGGVYYRGGPWVAHHYVYRPVYGPHYHRATLYYRPPNYAYAYNRPYPGNTHYNPNNYYNNYRGNTNNQNKSNNTINRNVSGNNVTINTGNQVNKAGNAAVKTGNAQANPSWKGQSTYNGGSKTNGNAANNASRNPSNTSARTHPAGHANTQAVKPDRGYSPAPSSNTTQRTSSRQAAAPRTSGAFDGAGNNGRTERASSQRGAASTQAKRGNK